MDKDTFTNINDGWWLLEQDLTPNALKEARDALAAGLGWDPLSWYTDQNKVIELYQGIENGQPLLLTELDEAIDERKQEEWLLKVKDLLAPEAEAEEPEKDEVAPTVHDLEEDGEAAPAAAPAEAPAEDPGTWNEDWQMLTRVGPDGAHQFAFSDDHQAVRPGTQWMSQDQATAEKSAAGPASEAPESASEPEAATTEGGAVSWDAQWGMFLRFEDGNYQYALSNLLADGPGTEAPAGQPDGTWHATAEEASAARQAVADLKDTFSDLAADPDVPISEEDLNAALQDPDFQKNLADADAALEAELAAMEAEG